MYSDDPHYRELVRILAEILAQGYGQHRPPADLAAPPPTEERETGTRAPRHEPVPLIVQLHEEVQ